MFLIFPPYVFLEYKLSTKFTKDINGQSCTSKNEKIKVELTTIGGSSIFFNSIH